MSTSVLAPGKQTWLQINGEVVIQAAEVAIGLPSRWPEALAWAAGDLATWDAAPRPDPRTDLRHRTSLSTIVHQILGLVCP